MNASRPPGPTPTKNVIALARYFWAFRKDASGVVGGRFRDHGDMYYAEVGDSKLYVTRHPEHIEQVLLKQNASFKKMTGGRGTRQFERLVGNGLVLSDGDLWRRQRRMINPAFSGKRLGGYAEVMVERTQRMLEGWEHGQAIDVSHAMIHLTLAIVGETLFAHDIHGENDEFARLMMSIREVLGVAGFLPSWLPVPAVKRAERTLEALDKHIYALVDERMASDDDLATNPDLLSALIHATDPEGGAKMDRKQLRDELLTLFIAGHETTSHALTWTLYMISRHPEVEAQLLEEIDAALEGRPVTMEDLANLPMTDQVLKESMRLLPPVPVIARVATEDVEVGGYKIPQGAEIIMWMYHTHRDARWFPEPLRFDPSRFTKEAERALPSCAYMPFGAGQRTCIGKRFALMEARLILTTILQRYRLVLEPGFEPTLDFTVTLAPAKGMPMTAVARPHTFSSVETSEAEA